MEPMQVCFSHQTAFQVLRAIDARELAGSGDTARRLPARAPSARGLEEVVKRIENDRPGLSIERPVHILLGAASRCRSTSRRVSHVCTRQMRGKPLLRLSDGVGVCSAPFACVQAAPSAKNKIDQVILEIDVQGGFQVRDKFPSAHLVFIEPPSLDVLEARLRGRGTETEEAIATRMETARVELSRKMEYDIRLVNDDLDEAVRALAGYVNEQAEKIRG